MKKEIYGLHIYIGFFTILGIILYLYTTTKVGTVAGLFLMECGILGHFILIVSLYLANQNDKK